ncbi:MAG: PHP domain-containing protein [Actinomycetota bacterium]|nr:PHP domain-containing protein [Actinomycetota bacterium]
MPIDLHAHTTASDGTDTPAELVRAAAEASIDVLALTDHDTTAGWASAVQALPDGLTLVRGAEVSCTVEGVSMHLLAYLFDPDHPNLAAELDRTRDDRVNRAREIVRRLAADGHPVTWEQVLAMGEPGGVVGRPHVADALVAAGVVADRDEAFASLLHSRSPYFVSHYAPHPVDVVRLVRAAGGVVVFAHPGAHRRGATVGDDVIVSLADAGLHALEVDHPDHDPATRARLRALAGELGLLVTGSSDYHGTGKPQRLGVEQTDPEVFAELVAQASGCELVSR